MKIFHPFYNNDIDTKSLETVKNLGRVNSCYECIPETECVNCPNKEGVEADCCKTFSPPMFLSEFMNILRKMEGDGIEKLKSVLIKTVDYALNPETSKPCPLLNDICCDYYIERPLSCRLFGLYPPAEWNKRLKHLSAQSGVPEKEMPFADQCRGVKSKTKCFVSTMVSDSLMSSLKNVDVDFLGDDKETGKEIVNTNAATYMTFDSHLLSLFIGPENADILCDMKLFLRTVLMKAEIGDYTPEQVEKIKKSVSDFGDAIKENIKKITIGD